MSRLYHKVAVASVCTALGFVLGASPEAKAATFTLEPTITFGVIDWGYQVWNEEENYLYYEFDGVGDLILNDDQDSFGRVRDVDLAHFAEFNIDSFSLLPNKVIRSVLLQTQILSFEYYIGSDFNPGSVSIFGYVGNGTAETSDLEAGISLNSVDTSSSSPGDILSFDVTRFVNQRVSNADAFAGFAIRALNPGYVQIRGNNSLGTPLRMVVETADAEPVPEPITIFGSAIALGVGGWLKRKNLSRQNKTMPQR